MATTIQIKQGDNAREIKDTLLFGGVPIDLTTLAVNGAKLRLKRYSNDEAIMIQASVDGAPTLGQVKAPFTNPTHSGTVDKFKAEWELTFNDGRVLSVPDDDYNVIEIVEQLG